MILTVAKSVVLTLKKMKPTKTTQLNGTEVVFVLHYKYINTADYNISVWSLEDVSTNSNAISNNRY